ncbi:MAG: tetratricopeptide repeat protein [Planctomycetota bacterium]
MKKSIGDVLREGLGLYGQGQFEEAVEVFQAGLAEHPESTDLLLHLGMSEMNAGRLEPALATLEKLTGLVPTDPMGFTSLSMCLQRMDQIEAAEKAQAQARLLSWKQELKSNPNAPPPDDGPMRVQQ